MGIFRKSPKPSPMRSSPNHHRFVTSATDSKNQQYLVAAYWLKEHGNSPTVTADKIYTCYKTANWSAGFNDWSQTFHNLVHAEYMRKVGKGEFAINPTGEHLVKKGNG